jgi:5-bromo-4-chloroindolyl phosphate hydrolysis protein
MEKLARRELKGFLDFKALRDYLENLRTFKVLKVLKALKDIKDMQMVQWVPKALKVRKDLLVQLGLKDIKAIKGSEA